MSLKMSCDRQHKCFCVRSGDSATKIAWMSSPKRVVEEFLKANVRSCKTSTWL